MKLGSRLRAAASRLSRPRQLIEKLGRPVDRLAVLADRYGSDKGALANSHHYTRVYSHLFGKLGDRPVRLLEIGLLCVGPDWINLDLRDTGGGCGRDAPSLRMWADYFPNGRIFGLDRNDFSGVEIDRCRIFRGDMSKPADLMKVVAAAGGEFDIIIDDASHVSDHQQIALGTLFPILAPGGLYIIEDLSWQPAAPRERPDALKTQAFLRRAELDGIFTSPCISAEASAYLQDNVERVALFDSLKPRKVLSGRDNLGVLWKKDART